MALDPFAFLEVLGFDVDFAVGFEGGGGLDLCDAIGVADDFLVACQSVFFGRHGPPSHHASGREVVILELGRLGVDGDHRFASVSPFIE